MRQPLRQPHPIRTSEIENFEDNAEYVGYIDGSNYILKNGNTGLETTYTNAATMIQAGLDATENGRFVLKKGKYIIDTKLTLTNYGVDFSMNSMWEDSVGVADVAGIWAANALNDDMLLINGLKCHVHDLVLNGNKPNNASGSCIKTVNNTSLDLHLTDVYLIFAKEYGLGLYGAAGHFVGVYSEYCDKVGFFLESSATRNNFLNCGSYSCNWGYEVKRSENRFLGCIAADSTEYGWLIESSGAVKNILDGCMIQNTTKEALWLYGGSHNIISNCIFYNAGDGTDNTYAAVKISLIGGPTHSTHNLFSNNLILSDAANKHRWGFYEVDANQDFNMYMGNMILDSQTAGMSLLGVNDIVKDNMGWINEAQGVTGAVADGGTFAHGLASTPLGCVLTGTVTGDIIKVTGLGAANVTVSIKDEGGGAGTAQVLYWKAWF